MGHRKRAESAQMGHRKVPSRRRWAAQERASATADQPRRDERRVRLRQAQHPDRTR